LENNHQCVPFGLFITNINNIKFSTKKAEKEQVNIKKATCNNEQMEFLCA
jgi:hypothetical protein